MFNNCNTDRQLLTLLQSVRNYNTKDSCWRLSSWHTIVMRISNCVQLRFISYKFLSRSLGSHTLLNLFYYTLDNTTRLKDKLKSKLYFHSVINMRTLMLIKDGKLIWWYSLRDNRVRLLHVEQPHRPLGLRCVFSDGSSNSDQISRVQISPS